jgi:DNA-binding winged helix-turn-helix (wHTH) protein
MEESMKMQRVNSAVLEAVHIPGGDFTFNAPDLELMSSFDATDLPPALTRLELDTYRIALVPLSGQHGNADRKPSTIGKIANLLLLPFTWKELMTQVRREAEPAKTHVLSFSDVRIDLLSMEVLRAGDPVVLTTMEFKVLKFFVLNPNRVISRDELLNQVWGYDNYPCTRTVDNHLMRLRQKLEPDAANPTHFRTVHGIGYKFLPEPRMR